MTTELTYNVTYKPKEKKYYQLLGPKGELLYFYNKRWSKCRLITGDGADYIKFESKGIFNNDVNLNFIFFSKLNSIKFFPKTFSGYRVTGNYLGCKDNINWSWKPSGGWSTSWILTDKNFQGQVMAKIKGLSLKRNKSGTLAIASGVPQDFHDTIVATACLIWMIDQNRTSNSHNQAVFSSNMNP